MGVKDRLDDWSNDPKRTLYHATWCGNIDSIMKVGLIPRTEEEVEETVNKILAEYGYTRKTVPFYIWGYPLLRLKETVGKVYLSGDPLYALQNCLAGFEAETQLRSYLKAKKEHKKMRYLPIEEALKERISDFSCGICEVELDDSEISEIAIWKKRYEDIGPEYREERGWKTFEDFLEFILEEGSQVVIEGKIGPESIKSCGCVGPGITPFMPVEELRKRAIAVYEELGTEIPERFRW